MAQIVFIVALPVTVAAIVTVFSVWPHRPDVTPVRGNAPTRSHACADVAFCCRLPDMLQRLAARHSDVKPGCRIVCHQFQMPGWTPVTQVTL